MKVLTNTIIAISIFLPALNLNAATISFNGYERDSASNIVTGNGLEWLMWDVTAGMSINTALSSYAANGWRLANNSEVAVLFNSFQNFTFDDDPATQQQVYAEHVRSGASRFTNLFGSTINNGSGPLPRITSGVNAYFGEGPNQYNGARVAHEYVSRTCFVFSGCRYLYRGKFTMQAAQFTADTAYASDGVALVRVSSVPIPAPVWLFGSGLLGLIGVARKKT